jgi:hypothetical protein
MISFGKVTQGTGRKIRKSSQCTVLGILQECIFVPVNRQNSWWLQQIFDRQMTWAILEKKATCRLREERHHKRIKITHVGRQVSPACHCSLVGLSSEWGYLVSFYDDGITFSSRIIWLFFGWGFRPGCVTHRLFSSPQLFLFLFYVSFCNTDGP